MAAVPSIVYSILTVLVILAVVYLKVSRDKSKRQLNAAESRIIELNSRAHDMEATSAKLASQNDWLITEMHHRVKNNLQIVNSLINSQLSYIKTGYGREALVSCRHRLYALSLIHQKLFQTSMVSELDLPCYIAELVGYLTDEFDANQKISFRYDMAPVSLDVSLAIPMGLIVNEVVSNALKFAYPGDERGNIKISLKPQTNGNFRLTIADEGVGLPGHSEFESGKTLGGSLITGLAMQMKASIDIVSESGVAVILTFSTYQSGQYGLAAS